jgi:CBS domain containing-hemolysin-like protein
MSAALVATALLLVANGFFVAVEFAVLASRRTRVEALAESGQRRARLALAAMRDLNAQLAGAQLGITMASLLLGFVAEPAFAELIESLIGDFVDLPDAVLHGIGFGLGLGIVVFLHILVGEMVPKNLAIAQPEQTLLWLVIPNRAYVVVFSPVVRVLNIAANAIVKLLGVEPRDELATSRSAEEIANIVSASRQEGLIADVEHQLLTGALDLGDRPVRAVMVPRDRVVAVPRSATPAEAEQVVTASGHSRLLVHGGDLDDVLGFLHAKDLLTVPAGARTLPLPLGRIRPVLVAAGDETLTAVLVAMQRARVHVAVIHEGATTGIVTLEDVLEALVGDIRDESDPVLR